MTGARDAADRTDESNKSEAQALSPTLDLGAIARLLARQAARELHAAAVSATGLNTIAGHSDPIGPGNPPRTSNKELSNDDLDVESSRPLAHDA